MKKMILAAGAVMAALLPLMATADDWTKWKADEFELEAPPRKNSAAHRRELATLLEYQRNDREDACDLAKRQRFAGYNVLFVRSGILTHREGEKAKELVTKVLNLTQRISKKFKKYYDRPRPYTEDSRIEPCIPEPGVDQSYPSSHASMGWAGACVLAEIFPEKARMLQHYGQEVGDTREMVGVHFPSDVAAGQELGAEICRRLLADRDFQEALENL